MANGNDSLRDPSLELDPETMRRLGYRAVDLLVERWVTLNKEPAWQFGTRRELEGLLREDPPEAGRDPEQVLERVTKEVLPRAGRIDHPRFFAFIPSSPTWPSVLGDLLATGFNIFQGTWLESAGPSQLELVVLDWFRTWLGMPESAGGLLTSGGSVANLLALVAARERAGNPSHPVVYLSSQGHSSLERAARTLGIPPSSVRKIEVDRAYRMDIEALRSALRIDREAGLRPLLVAGNAGTTNTGAVDPLQAMADLAREAGTWFHVDAAYGGFAVLAPEGRKLLDGIHRADSVTLDPHKWFFQPYEAGCLLVRDVATLEEPFRIMPEYLQDAAMGKDHVNFADRGVQLTRRFRALKIWMTVQVAGMRAIRRAIERAMELAREAEAYIQASPDLELLSPASLGVVCFRVRPRGPGLAEDGLEALNAAVVREIAESGFAMISSTRLGGRFSLRLAILNYRSTGEDVLGTLQRIEALGRAWVRKGGDA